MTKSTAAVIMVSAAKLPPWGDEGWRFAGAMQLVQDGPDWLHAQWPVLDGAEHHPTGRFATMVLRDDADQRAEDIAAMVYALLRVPEWRQLTPWWDSSADRQPLAPTLRSIADKYADAYKLAVVQTSAGVGADVLSALRSLHFDVVKFTRTDATT